MTDKERYQLIIDGKNKYVEKNAFDNNLDAFVAKYPDIQIKVKNQDGQTGAVPLRNFKAAISEGGFQPVFDKQETPSQEEQKPDIEEGRNLLLQNQPSGDLPSVIRSQTQDLSTSLGLEKDYYNKSGIFTPVPRLEGQSEEEYNKKQAQAENRVQIAQLREQLDKQINERFHQIHTQAPEKQGFLSQLVQSVGENRGGTVARNYSMEANAPVLDDKSKNLNAADRLLKESEAILHQVDKNKKGGTFIGGALRGLKDGIFNIDTWTNGVSDMVNSTALATAIKKYEQGKPLTEDEDALLTASAVNMATNALFSENLGHGYTSARGVSGSIPFMLEFIANPASGIGKGIGRKVAEYGLKKLGKGLVTKTISRGARVLGDIAGSSIMTATTGSAGTLADAAQRFGQGENILTALGKAFGARSIENFSEMAGPYFGPVGNMLSKSKVSKVFNKSVAGKLINRINNSPVSKFVKNKMQFQNWASEGLEEQLGGTINALTIGDQSLKEVWSSDNIIDNFLGAGMMGGFFTGVKAIGYRSPSSRIKNYYKKAKKEAQTNFGDKWGEYQSLVDSGDENNQLQALKNIIQSPDITDEQRLSLFKYKFFQSQIDGFKKSQNQNENPLASKFKRIYEEGYSSVDTPESKKQALQDVKTASKGFTPEQLNEIENIDNPTDYIAAHPEQAEQLQTYFTAKAKLDGLKDAVKDNIEDRILAEKESLKQQTHEDGNIYQTTLFDKPVYITKGNLVLNPDHTVDQEKSDKIILVHDGNKIEAKSIKDIPSIERVITASEMEASWEQRRNVLSQLAIEEFKPDNKEVSNSATEVIEPSKDQFTPQKFTLEDGRTAIATAANEKEVAYDILDQHGEIIDSDIMPREEFSQLKHLDENSQTVNVPEETSSPEEPIPAEAQNDPVPTIPLTKDGRTDYKTLLDTDVNLFAQEWEKKRGPEKTKQYLQREMEALDTDIKKLSSRLEKERDPNKIDEIEEKIDLYTSRRDNMDAVIREKYSFQNPPQQIAEQENNIKEKPFQTSERVSEAIPLDESDETEKIDETLNSNEHPEAQTSYPINKKNSNKKDIVWTLPAVSHNSTTENMEVARSITGDKGTGSTSGNSADQNKKESVVSKMETAPPADVSYTIEPAQYTTKRGKVLDMHLVKFGKTLSKLQQRAAKELAKVEKGWYDTKQDGFMMRNEESAKRLADTILNNEDAVSDAQPISLADTRRVLEPQQVNEQNLSGELNKKGEAKLSDYTINPSGNRLVTDERYEELRKQMRRKLGGQMNIGIDPEILAIGTEMAVYHLEKGARKFTEYAKAMIASLGDAIRPYLKAFYNGARNLPEVSENGLDADMTPYDEVQAFDIANFDKPSIDTLATAETVTKETEVTQEVEVAQERIKKTRSTRKKNEKKAVASQKSNELNSFEGLFDINEINNEDGLQRNDAARSERVPANGNQHKQGLSGGSETGSERERQENRGTDNGGKRTGDAVDRTVRPRLSDTLNEQSIEGKRKKEVERNHKLADELKGVTLHFYDKLGGEREISGIVYYELANVFHCNDNVSGPFQATRKELDAILKVARKSDGKAETFEPKNTHNNHSERGKDHAPTSVDARIEANIKAIELAKQLLESGEQATEKQMQTLRKFSGWGGLGKVFNERANYVHERRHYWNEPTLENKKLRELLGEKAYQEAVMSANSAYYTPAYVIDTLWGIAEKMGFKGGNILEGSAGIGNILGQMPTHISEQSDIHAIEIDSTSGGILSLLYPDAQVEIQGFEQTRIQNGSVDLAITNVPFVTGLRVNDTTGDKDLSKRFHNIHDFCIAKNIRKLREGGLGIFITSNGTLDSSKKLRDWIVSEGGADFVGAFRMHNKTFGGTGVTSDIIVIRKRVNGQKSTHAIDVSTISGERMAEFDTGETRKVKGKETPIIKQLSMDYNRYFIEHPENMAGEMHFAFEKGDSFRPTSKGLYPKQDKKQEQMLAEFVQSFNAEEFGERSTDAVTDVMPGKKIGEMFVKYGKLYINSTASAQLFEVNANKVKGHTKVECFEAYTAIKEALTEVLAYQTENESDEGLKPLLDKLNRAYDDFVATYGHFNKNTAIAFLRNDVDYANVFALEKYEETADAKGNRIQKFGKTDVFSKRVIEKEKELTPTNVKDGIIASIFKFGRVDVPYIAEQLGTGIEDVKKEIIESGYGFENPVTRQIEASYQYLSGNVRQKLRQAEENNKNREFDRNVKALQEVMPMEIPAHLIDFTLGSSWIDPKLYEEYVKERTDIEVQFTAVGGTWFMKSPSEWMTNKEKNRSMGVVSEMLGRTIMGHTLIEAAIQNRSITVSTTKKHYDGTTETITDKEATQACAAKIDEIRQEFKDWARQKMQSDPEMSALIEHIYNDTFNNFVPMSIPDEFVPEYFGGASHKFKMRPHQGRAIVRGTQQPLLLAHEVGTGKTFTLISTAMEMRRLGTARKPMIVVQNATVGQFVASAKDLYPNAKILTLEEADRNAEGRKNFYAKIRYNDWDMIVVPQSAFEFIPDSDEREMTFVQEKIEEKMLILEKMKEEDPDGKSMITRQAEREIELLEEQLAGISDKASKKRTANDEKKRAVALQNAEVKAMEMLDRRTDDVENFDDMGIDALLVDEAHEYKHLGFATAMQRGVKGVDPSYSKKSQGVFLKTQAVLEKNNGRNVIFATGTPISNTAAEIWTFMRYLMPADTMKEYGIYYFDDFVRNFGNIQQMLEFNTSGKFKENNRFAGYVNLPELIRIWSGVSDTVLTKEADGVEDKIPEIENGKAQDLYLPQTRALRGIMKFVKGELKAYDKMSGRKKKENSHIPLTMYGIAKAAAVDTRLVQTDAEDDANSKTNEAVRQTLRSLKETANYKGTVAIFADNYQNKQSGFNLYDDIRNKLIAEGIPADEIVVMRSEMTVKKKLEIFEKVNRGEVRVILGSTFTLGTGVNIQERLHTLIHLDAPNRPMDYTQRNGRILRQGNLHKAMGKPVRILRFGVEDSLDVTAYQRLKTKGAIADSIMNGKQMMSNSMTNRVLEEEEDVFGDTVAQLSGSEYAMLKNNAEKNMRKYASRKKQWEADQTYIHNAKPRIKGFIKDAEARIEQYGMNLQNLRTAFPDGKFKEIVIGNNRIASIEKMEDFFKEHNKNVLAEIKKMKDGNIAGQQTRELSVKIGDFSFKVKTKLKKEISRDDGTLFAEIHRKMTYSCPELGIENAPVHQSLLRNAIMDITKNVITGKDFAEQLEAAERSKKHNEAELEQLLSREGKPFEYENELAKAQEQYEKYSELMKKELEEKEAKYAEMDKTVEAATDIANAEEDNILYRSDDTMYRIRNVFPKYGASIVSWINQGKLINADVDTEVLSTTNGVKNFENPKSGDDIRFRHMEDINRRFNDELQQQISGTLPKGHVYQLGRPGETLRSAGIPNLPVELAASRLSLKASETYENNHPFDLSAIINLPDAIQSPIAVFDSKTQAGSKVIMTELTDTKGNNFVLAMRTNVPKSRYGTRSIQINDIRSVYPKDNIKDIINWVNRGDLLKWADKTKLRNWLTQQRSNSAEVAIPISEFDVATNIVKNFESPTLSEGEILSEIDNISQSLHTPVNVIRNIEQIQEKNKKDQNRKRKAKGFYDIEKGEVTVLLPNATDISDIQRTLLHEIVGHKGLRELLGKHFEPTMEKVFGSLSGQEQVDLIRKHGTNKVTCAEEYLASLAEKSIKPSTIQKIISTIKEAFRQLGIDLKFSNADMLYMLWRSQNRLSKDMTITDRLRDLARTREAKIVFREITKETSSGEEVTQIYVDPIKEAKEYILNSKLSKDEMKHALIGFIKNTISSNDADQMGKRELSSLLTQVDKANTKYSLGNSLIDVEKTIYQTRTRNAHKKLNRILSLKIQGRNNKNMSIAKNVDDNTRKIFQMVRGTLSDIKKSGLDEDLSILKKEIKELSNNLSEAKEKKDLEKITSLEQQITIQEEKIAELKKEREELTKAKENAYAVKIDEEIKELNDKFNESLEGKTTWNDEDAIRLTALNVLKHFQEITSRETDIKSLHDKLSRLRKDNSEKTKAQIQEISTDGKAYILENRRQMNALRSLINNAQKSYYEDINDLNEILTDLVEKGHANLITFQQEQLERKKSILRQSIYDIKGKKKVNLFEKDSKGHAVDKTKSSSLLNFLISPIRSFEYLCKTAGQKYLPGDGFLYQYFIKGKEGVLEAQNTYITGLKDFNQTFESKIEEIFGKDYKKIIESSDKLIKSSGVHFIESNESVQDFGQKHEMPLTKGQAMYIYMVWKMDDGKCKLLLQGINDETISEIINFLGPEYVKFADWIQDELLPATHKKYNKTYKKIYGTSLNKIENYVPLKIKKEATQQDVELENDYKRQSLQERAGSLINRVHNTRPVDITQNAFNVIYNHAEQMESWNAFAQVRKDLDGILSSTYFRNLMNTNKKGSYDNFKEAAALATHCYHSENLLFDKAMSAMSKGVVGGYIAFRLYTASKQVLSLPAFLGYSQNPQYILYLLKNTGNITKLKKNYDWCKENIPSFYDRVKSGNVGNEKLDDVFGGKIDEYIKTGMLPNRIVDALTCSIGAKSIYEYRYEQYLKQNKSKEEAHRLAIMEADIYYNQSQQSSQPAFLSPTQKSHSFLARMVTTFQNNDLGYNRTIFTSAKTLLKSREWKYLNDLYTQKFMGEEGLNQKDASSKAKNYLINQNKKAFFSIALFGYGLRMLWNYGLLGMFKGPDDDDKEPEDVLKEVAYYSIMPMKGLPLGNILDNAYKGFDYNPFFFTEELSDAFKDITKVAKENGWISPTVAYTALQKASKLTGVDLEVWSNMYLGLEGMIENGQLDIDLLDFALLFNVPKSERVNIAKKLYKDNYYDFITNMSRARKTFDNYRSVLPGSTKLTSRKKSAINKEWLENNTHYEKN